MFEIECGLFIVLIILNSSVGFPLTTIYNEFDLVNTKNSNLNGYYRYEEETNQEVGKNVMVYNFRASHRNENQPKQVTDRVLIKPNNNEETRPAVYESGYKTNSFTGTTDTVSHYNDTNITNDPNESAYEASNETDISNTRTEELSIYNVTNVTNEPSDVTYAESNETDISQSATETIYEATKTTNDSTEETTTDFGVDDSNLTTTVPPRDFVLFIGSSVLASLAGGGLG